jgi:peptide/nickel transport system substrate-binding protein
VNRRDRAAVVALLSALAIIVALVALPSFESPGSIATPSPSPSGPPVAVYREGVIGRSSSITPLTARGAADRELVALVFSGLVRLGPDGDVVPDLAESWDVDDTGARYTFRLRRDAVWQDGEPVTASDVAFTVKMLQDPGYAGPEATSWREVSVTVLDERTVRFDLATPLGGFLQAATQPLLPEHLLQGVAAADLADSPFSRAPVGSGLFRLVAIDGLHAELAPAPPPLPVAAPTPSTGVDNLATAPPPPPPSRPTPYLDAIELHFFNDAASLAATYQAGRLDAAVGLPPTSSSALAAGEGSRLLRYPSTTLTAVYMNQRGKSVFRDVRVRRALSALIDRDALVETVLAGQGTRADSLIPPSSWAFDAKASKPVAFDRKAATTFLKKAGWRKLSSGWAAPGRTKPLVLTVIAPDQMSNAVTYAAARQIAKAWSSFGFRSTSRDCRPPSSRSAPGGTFSLPSRM